MSSDQSSIPDVEEPPSLPGDDRGAGLPVEFLPHAFERFSRAQRGRVGPGTGLGLAIVELIAVAHGGRAGLANRTDGPGTDAWVRLPAVSAVPAGLAGGRPYPGPEG